MLAGAISYDARYHTNLKIPCTDGPWEYLWLHDTMKDLLHWWYQALQNECVDNERVDPQSVFCVGFRRFYGTYSQSHNFSLLVWGEKLNAWLSADKERATLGGNEYWRITYSLVVQQRSKLELLSWIVEVVKFNRWLLFSPKRHSPTQMERELHCTTFGWYIRIPGIALYKPSWPSSVSYCMAEPT